MFNIVILSGIVITLATGVPTVLQLRSHPRGLIVLFFAEMWERFSYYGMRGMLIFYLSEHFLFDDGLAQGQYAAYTTLAYTLPLVGGFVADRWLGSRKAIAFGALLLVAGHFTMAIEGPPASEAITYKGHVYAYRLDGRMEGRKVCLQVGSGCYGVGGAPGGGLEIKALPAAAPLPSVIAAGSYVDVRGRSLPFLNLFYLALALIIMGVGFLKANIASIVGHLYGEGDPRRDPGFTLYYYGINLGAFWAAILCGLIGQTVGWGAGFGLAGLGMLAGYLVFVSNTKRLAGFGEPPDPERLGRQVAGVVRLEWAIYLAAIAGLAGVWWMVQQVALTGWLLLTGWIAALAYIGFEMTRVGKVGRDRLILAILLVLGSIVFFALAEQAGTSLSQFAERNTTLPSHGFWAITPAQTPSFNAGYILLFAPPLAWLWGKLGERGLNPNPLAKYGLGLMQIGLGFWVLTWAASYADTNFRTPLYFLAFSYLLQTTGELCLSPVGLSEMTKLAPARMISTLMAIALLGASSAQYLAGAIARFTATATVGGEVLSPAKALATYAHVFLIIGTIGCTAGLLYIALSVGLKRLAHGTAETGSDAYSESAAMVSDRAEGPVTM
jgi:proton-dependent oligopeptide transporter, POT family